MKKLLKGIVTVLLLIVMEALSIIDCVIEFIYQLVKLVRRGYRYLTTSLIKLTAPLCKDDKIWNKIFNKKHEGKTL